MKCHIHYYKWIDHRSKYEIFPCLNINVWRKSEPLSTLASKESLWKNLSLSNDHFKSGKRDINWRWKLLKDSCSKKEYFANHLLCLKECLFVSLIVMRQSLSCSKDRVLYQQLVSQKLDTVLYLNIISYWIAILLATPVRAKHAICKIYIKLNIT